MIGWSNEFPLKRVPNPDDFDPEQLEAIRALMAATREAVAPNPIAQAMMPPLAPPKAKRAKDR